MEFYLFLAVLMKNKFLLLSIAAIGAMSIFSCKDEEETKTAAPSIVGTWEMTKVSVKAYIAGVKLMDTTMMADPGSSSIAYIKEDKSIMLIDSDGSDADTTIGTYSVTGTKLVLNLIDPVDGPYTEEYQNLSYNATEMTFTGYDPDATSPNRTEFTPTFKRK